MKTMSLKFERVIAGRPAEVYAAWLNPKIPGTPWNENKKLLLNAKLDGFFYWLTNQVHHYGRFTKLERGKRIQHTWMSRYTNGEESLVTVTFRKAAGGTKMTLVHSKLPKDARGRAHEGGWNYFLDKLVKTFAKR